MKRIETAQIRQQDLIYPGNQGFYGGQGEFPYPGIESSFPGGSSPNLPAPYAGAQAPASAAGTGSSLNFNQIKGFIDRMGGIDGIVGTMTRVQKMVATFQQMAPMIKLLIGSFGGAKAAAKSINGSDGHYYGRRKRRRSKSSRRLKKYRSPSGTTWTPKKTKRR